VKETVHGFGEMTGKVKETVNAVSGAVSEKVQSFVTNTSRAGSSAQEIHSSGADSERAQIVALANQALISSASSSSTSTRSATEPREEGRTLNSEAGADKKIDNHIDSPSSPNKTSSFSLKAKVAAQASLVSGALLQSFDQFREGFAAARGNAEVVAQ